MWRGEVALPADREAGGPNVHSHRASLRRFPRVGEVALPAGREAGGLNGTFPGLIQVPFRPPTSD